MALTQPIEAESTAEPAPTRTAAAVEPRPWPGIVLAAGMALTAAVLIYAGRELTFFYDEWDFILGRRGGGLESLLEPHNEHLSLVPVVAYKVLGSIVGLEQYIAYRLVVVGLHLLAAGLVFRIVKARLGAWEGVLAAGFLLGLGAAWQDLLWPFQIGFIGSVVAGLGALISLDRGTRRADVTAAALAGGALASSSLGVPILIGLAVELLAARRGGHRRLAVVVGPPFALYALWSLLYGRSALDGENLDAAAGWTVDAAGAAAGAVAGLELREGRVVLLVLLVALVAGVATRRVRVTPRLAGLAATALAFWVLTALARADQVPPDASRYLYLGGVVVILAVAEALRSLPRPRWALAATALVLAAAAAANAVDLRDGARGLRATSDVVAAELAAVELAGDAVPPDYQPDPARAPQLRAGPYAAVVKDSRTSAADDPERLGEAGGAARFEVDRVLQELGAVTVSPASPGRRAGAAPAVERASGARVSPSAGCLRVAPAGGARAEVDLVLPAAGLDVVRSRSPVELRARRYFEQFAQGPVGRLGLGAPASVIPRADKAKVPWRLRVSATAPLALCARAG